MERPEEPWKTVEAFFDHVLRDDKVLADQSLT
jgi:hypothetical protein